MLSAVLQTQAALLQRLLGRNSSGGQDSIGSILSGTDGSDDSGLKLPGARGAAAKEAFRQEVRKRPLGIARTIHENMSQALNMDPVSTGERAPSMRAYFKQETCFGNYKTLTYLGFAVATAFDWLSAGDQNLDHVKGLLALTCAAVDQVALDGGSWTLASQMLCLPEPPWNYVSRSHPNPNQTPFTPLADPKWVAAIMGYLKDVDALKSQRRMPNYQRPEDAPRPSPKASGSAQSRPSKGSGKGEAAASGAAAAAASG